MDDCPRCRQPEQYGCACTTLDVSEWRADEIEKLRGALKPFAFLDEDNPDATTQDAWEMRYRDRFSDWVDFGDIEKARMILKDGI